MFYLTLDRDGVVVWKNFGPPGEYRGAQVSRPIWDLKECQSHGHERLFYAALERSFAAGQCRLDYSLLTPSGWQHYNTWFYRSAGWGGFSVESVHYPKQMETLPDQELRIMQLIAEHHDTREIAAAMHIRPGTVQSYCRRLLERLRLPNSRRLAVVAKQFFGQ